MVLENRKQKCPEQDVLHVRTLNETEFRMHSFKLLITAHRLCLGFSSSSHFTLKSSDTFENLHLIPEQGHLRAE